MRRWFTISMTLAAFVFLSFIGYATAGNLEWTNNAAFPIMNDQGQNLAAGSLVQLIWVGPDGQINPPSPTGDPTGDDQLVPDSSDNENPTAIGGVFGDPGVLYVAAITYPDEWVNRDVYTRVFNGPTGSESTFYGNSAVYKLTGTLGEQFDVTASGSFSTNIVMPAAAPVVTSVDPASGLNSGVVAITINGSSFRDGATVFIGTTAATDVHVADAATIHATVPAGIEPGSYAVKVTNPDDQVSNLDVLYAANAALSVTSVDPPYGASFSMITVTIRGTGFQAGATVKVDENIVQSTVIDSTTISATFLTGDTGSYSITVENTDGQVDTSENAFVINPAPTIASVEPATGPPDQTTPIVVTGTGFLEGATVKIGETAATNVSRDSETTLSATVPVGLSVGVYDILVTNPDTQSASLPVAFTVAYQAGAIQVTMPAELTGIPGTAIDLPISINKSTGIMAWDMILTFDPNALIYDGITRGAITQNYAAVEGNEVLPGVLNVGAMTLEPTTEGGVLITVHFIVDTQAVGSSSINLSFKDDPGNHLRNVDESSSTFTPEPRVLTVGSATKLPGEAVTIPISINEFDGVEAFNMTLQYDAQALDFVSIDRAGTLTEFYLFDSNAATPGIVQMGAISLDPPPTGPGVVANVLFTVKSTAVGISNLTLTDLTDSLQGSTVEPGTLTVPDVVAPTVTAFVIPAISKDLTIAVTTLEAADNVGVTGYLITESPDAPTADAQGWSATPPASYTFATQGAKTLYAWAKDGAGNVSPSISAAVNVDTTVPTVTSFVIPATSTTLIVSITSFVAADNVGVTGYLVTESAAAPAADAPGWSATASTSYTFETAGAKTLYAWARDAAGNVSVSRSAGVNIIALMVTGIQPTSGFNDVDTTVTISGFNFAQGATVKIGTTPLVNVAFVSASQLTGKVPKGLSPDVYDITVTNPDGKSHTLAEAFTVDSPVKITPIPTTVTLTSGGAPYTFIATGGSGNYLYEKVEGPAGGMIDPQTGKFTTELQNSAGIYTIRVIDQTILDNVATFSFVVRVKVESKSVMQGLETSVGAFGGTAPYTCVSDNPAIAKVIQSADNGCLVMGLKQGKADITVTDSNPVYSPDERKTYAGVGRVIVFQGGKITGEVVDSANDVIPEATISVLETGGVYVSAQNGSFEVTLPFGKYTLSFSKANYVSDIRKVTLDKETLPLGKITLAEAVVSIGGTVEDLAGNGVAGADVFAVGLEQGNPKVFASSVTGDLGEFTLYLKTPASYELIAKKAGYGDSVPKSVNTGVTNAVVTMEVVVTSSESTVGEQRTTTIRIDDRGALPLAAPPRVTLREVDPDGAGPLLKRLGKGTLSPLPAERPAGNLMVWELTYIPKTDEAEPDADGHLIGILVEPLGAGVPTGAKKYSFTIHPTPAVSAPSKMVQTVINLGIVIVGKPVGEVTKKVEGVDVVVDADDGTNFVLDSENLTTPPGETRALNLTRFEIVDSTANQAVQNFGVTPMSEVYDFAFVDPDTGAEKGGEVKQITVKIKVNLATFDPNNWKPMISHDLTDPASWFFTEVVPGTVFFDGQYLSFDLTTLFGQGVVVASPPAAPVTPPAGGESAGGICFITTAAFGSSLEDGITKNAALHNAARVVLYPVIGIGKLMTVTTMGQKLAILLVFAGVAMGVVSIIARGRRRPLQAE